MKLIVDIDDYKIKQMKRFEYVPPEWCIEIAKNIANGISLDNIKEEIVKKHLSIIEKNDFDNGRTYGYEECLSIIDKNIGKE